MLYTESDARCSVKEETKEKLKKKKYGDIANSLKIVHHSPEQIINDTIYSSVQNNK